MTEPSTSFSFFQGCRRNPCNRGFSIELFGIYSTISGWFYLAPAGAKVPGSHVAFFYLAPRTSVAESIAERFHGLFTGHVQLNYKAKKEFYVLWMAYLIMCAPSPFHPSFCVVLRCFQPPNAKMYRSPVQRMGSCKGTEVEALLVLPPHIFQPSPSTAFRRSVGQGFAYPRRQT